MQHLNYCRQAIKELSTQTYANEKYLKEYRNYCIDLAKTSQKFILPDGGRLYDDPDLKALNETENLHLPFPRIAVEYTRSKQCLEALSSQRSDANFLPNKVLFLAEEAEFKISITVIHWFMAENRWVPFPPIDLPRVDYLDRTRQVNGRVAILAVQPDNKTISTNDYYDEVVTLLNLLNVLSCNNVHTEQSLPKKTSVAMNAGKKNAFPFDAYHYLVIDTPKKSESSGAGGSHASPREHLRRGHIRRLADGRRIWVNATVVSAGSGGVVAKDYVMRGAHGTNA